MKQPVGLDTANHYFNDAVELLERGFVAQIHKTSVVISEALKFRRLFVRDKTLAYPVW